MTSKQRFNTALEGGKPDRVPVFALYDNGYILRSAGRDVREWRTATAQEKVDMIESAFLRHDVDGFFVHPGNNDDWARRHSVVRGLDEWLVEDRVSGERYRLLPDGSRAPIGERARSIDQSAGGESRIRSESDIDALLPSPQNLADIHASGRFHPLQRLVSAYPDHHFSYQVSTPFVRALQVCGGFVEGLATLAEDRRLFRTLLERFVPESIERMAAAREVGAHSVLFTSYYTGADIISPRDYAEIVHPPEQAICRAAKELGFYVLHWFLGDLMPMLSTIVTSPIDALVLEQGRKTYRVDPVEIRNAVGPELCIFGFGYERDYIDDRREAITAELSRQISGAGTNGAFVAGTPIMPANAKPAAVDFYFEEAKRLGAYGRRTQHRRPQ